MSLHCKGDTEAAADIRYTPNAPCIRFVLQEAQMQNASAALFPCNYKTQDID